MHSATGSPSGRSSSGRRTWVLTAGLCALLGAGPLLGTAGAEITVERDGDVVTAIRGIELGESEVDVEFVRRTTPSVYGTPPTFDFPTPEHAHAATLAIVQVLNSELGIVGVGESAETAEPIFRIGFAITTDEVYGKLLTRVWSGATDELGGGEGVWSIPGDPDSPNLVKFTSPETFANFVISDPGGPGNPAPDADAGGPYFGVIGGDVPFDGTGSMESDGTIENYRWDFGDGSTGAGPRPAKAYDRPGIFNVTLIVTDDAGLSDADTTTAVVVGEDLPPIADAGGPYAVPAMVEFEFDGSGSKDLDGTIDGYEWSFGDGGTGVGQNPTHSYFNPGRYFVTVTVFDNSGNSSTDDTVVVVAEGNVPPVADPGDPVTGVRGEEVTFDGSGSTDDDGEIIAYEWDFGDGNLGTGVMPTHTYAEIGTYTVTLTVRDSGGGANSATTSANILTDNIPPTADAGGPYAGGIAEVLTLDGSGSDDPDGQILVYDWDFGDSTTGTGVMPEHEYLASGNYEVTLTVTDNEGATHRAYSTVSISVPDRPPLASAGGPYGGTAGQPLRLDGRNSGDPQGGPVTFEWDFGDDSAPGSGAQPFHIYAESGVYDITLTVTDDVGQTARSTTRALIGDGNILPIADAGGRYTGIAGDAVEFDGSDSRDLDGEVQSFEWDFGDGATGTGPTPTHTYAEAGLYFVTLRVTDDAGGSQTDVTLAQIGAESLPPTADAGGPYGGSVTNALTFDGSASMDPDGDIASYDWDFGDGRTGSGETVMHTYTETGTFLAVLTVTGDTGETSRDAAIVEIGFGNLPPIANAGGPYLGIENAPVQFDASGSVDLDGTIASYEWIFGDGQTGTGVSPTHTYAPGVYTVVVSVTDDLGAVDSAETYVVVLSDEPRMSPALGTIGTVVEILGFEFGDKKGKVFAEVPNKKGKLQKKQLKVTSWSNNRVLATWTSDVAPATYPVSLEPKGGDAQACGDFELRIPLPLDLPIDMGVPGLESEVSGFFFGAKQNNVKVEFAYRNSKGKDVTARATIRTDDSSFDPSNGASVIAFLLPNLKASELPATGILAIRTKVGDAVIHPNFTIETPPPPALTVLAPTDATIGTRVEIRGVGFGAKKSKVYAEVPNNKGKLQKKQLKIISWSAGRVVAEWSAKVAPDAYALFLQAKGFDPLELGALTIQAPSLLRLSETTASKGDRLTISGRYTGSKKATPKIVFEYESAKGKVVRKTCKVLKNEIEFDTMRGDGTVPFNVPKLNANDLPVTGTLLFSNKIGETEVLDQLTIEP